MYGPVSPQSLPKRENFPELNMAGQKTTVSSIFLLSHFEEWYTSTTKMLDNLMSRNDKKSMKWTVQCIISYINTLLYERIFDACKQVHITAMQAYKSTLII